MGAASKLVSTYVIRPVIAVAICSLVALAVQDASTTVTQLSLATPVAAAFALSAADMNRRAVAASGFAGAIAFGCLAAALDAADTMTGYDISFLIEWVVLSGMTGFFVWAVNFIWAATGQIRMGIDELVEPSPTAMTPQLPHQTNPTRWADSSRLPVPRPSPSRHRLRRRPPAPRLSKLLDLSSAAPSSTPKSWSRPSRHTKSMGSPGGSASSLT